MNFKTSIMHQKNLLKNNRKYFIGILPLSKNGSLCIKIFNYALLLFKLYILTLNNINIIVYVMMKPSITCFFSNMIFIYLQRILNIFPNANIWVIIKIVLDQIFYIIYRSDFQTFNIHVPHTNFNLVTSLFLLT